MPAAGFFDRAFAEPTSVRLIDDDPDLFAGLPDAARIEARARAIASVLTLPRGRWEQPARLDDAEQCLGLLVLDGLLVHSIVVASEPRSEVVGPGDLLRPWEENGAVASVSFTSRWEVVRPTRVAVLDSRMLSFAGRWRASSMPTTGRSSRC